MLGLAFVSEYVGPLNKQWCKHFQTWVDKPTNCMTCTYIRGRNSLLSESNLQLLTSFDRMRLTRRLEHRDRCFRWLEHHLDPAFSIGRTQELLFDIEQLIFEHRLSADIPIILDSPIALKVTRSYRLWELWGQERQNNDLNYNVIHWHLSGALLSMGMRMRQEKSSNRLRAFNWWTFTIVVATSVCVREAESWTTYLPLALPDKRTTDRLAGYQAHGTLGGSFSKVKCRYQSTTNKWRWMLKFMACLATLLTPTRKISSALLLAFHGTQRDTFDTWVNQIPSLNSLKLVKQGFNVV